MIRIATSFFIVSAALFAQFLPDLQARTPEEFDDYLDVVQAGSPAKAAANAERFAARWPESNLRLRVFELQSEAYRTLGDGAAAVRAAESGLQAGPDYIPLHVLIAGVHANATETTALDTARKHAERALALLDQAKAPRHITPENWVSAVARLRGEAHAALGVVAFKKGDRARAARELEQAVSSSPVAPHQFRLAMLYREMGRAAEAKALLEKVARCEEPELRQRAKEALAAR